MPYKRTLKYNVQRVEGLWSDDGDLIGEEPQPTEVVYYPFDLRELDDRATKQNRKRSHERHGDDCSPDEGYRQSLPGHPDQYRTGAVLLTPDPRDYQADWLPGIEAPPPASSTGLLALIKEPRLNQGGTGACVAGSSEGNCQLVRSALSGAWPSYSIPILYGEAGGTGQNGVDVRAVMKLCIDRGTPLLDGTREKVIASYAFVDATPGTFRTQVKAAIAAGHPVLIASLLPIPFGWNSGMALSQGYHQYLGVAYQGEQLIIFNDWGDGWPGDAPAGTPAGVGTISFDALEQAGQNGYRYAVLATALTITPPIPTPPIPVPPIPTPPIPVPPAPAITATVSGRAHTTEGATNGVWPKVGDTVPFGVGVSMVVTSLVYDSTPPIPVPPIPVPPIPTPGALHVGVQGGAHHILASTVQDENGKYLEATCTLTVGGTSLGSRPTHPQAGSAVPAVWTTVGYPPGSVASVAAVTGDGRAGSGQGTTS